MNLQPPPEDATPWEKDLYEFLKYPVYPGPVKINGAFTINNISFPATAVPSADPNTLDDYEEGYYTMMVDGSTSGSYAVSAAEDQIAYTKIGRVVHVQGSFSTTGETSAAGNLLFYLPFTAGVLTEGADSLVGSAQLYAHGGTLPNGVHALISSGLATFRLTNIADNGIWQQLDVDDVDSVWNMSIGFSYFI